MNKQNKKEEYPSYEMQIDILQRELAFYKNLTSEQENLLEKLISFLSNE